MTHPHTLPLLGNKLKLLNDEVSECSKCTFCTKHKALDRNYQFYPYLRPLEEDFYLFVGDYPTEVEDVLSKPLADKQGKFLREVISSFLPPEKYLVVNSVICFPHLSVPPTLQNQLDCSHHLLNYINTLKPKTVFSLGKLPTRLLKKLNLPFIELPSQDSVSSSDLQRQRFKLLLSKHLELQGKL